ncbi:hypothetical protein RQP46_005121 [Phenoliferia psychrophenolica]
MGKRKAFSNPKYILSGSKNQGFGVRGKVKTGGRVSREGAFPEGPGHVLNSRKAQSTGSRDARAIAASKRHSYSRTRAHHSDSDLDQDLDSQPDSNSNSDDESDEPDSDDLEGETPKERQKRQKREGKQAAAPPAARVLSDSARAANERAEREKQRMREPIVIGDTDEEEDDLDELDERIRKTLSPSDFSKYLARRKSGPASFSRNASSGPSPSSSPNTPRSRLASGAPSPDKKPLFRHRSPSLTPSDDDLPSPKKPKSAPSKKKSKKADDPRLTHTRVGDRTFQQKTYDPAPALDPAIEALLRSGRAKSEEEGSDDEMRSDEEGEAGVIARRLRREQRRFDEMEESAKKRKKEFREARGHGYSNPRRN